MFWVFKIYHLINIDSCPHFLSHEALFCLYLLPFPPQLTGNSSFPPCHLIISVLLSLRLLPFIFLFLSSLTYFRNKLLFNPFTTSKSSPPQIVLFVVNFQIVQLNADSCLLVMELICCNDS